jgi:hypothetical protein
VGVALAGSARVVDLAWEGGLEVEPPLAALTPGQADRGLRVLDLVAARGAFELTLEGPAGATGTLRLHGPPAWAEGGTLSRGERATELLVDLPASTHPFSRAVVRLGAKASGRP